MMSSSTDWSIYHCLVKWERNQKKKKTTLSLVFEVGFVKSKEGVVVGLWDVIEEEEERVINREKKERERGRGGDEEGIVSTCLGERCDVM